MAEVENWLGLESPLIERLVGKLDSKVKVLPARDITGIVEAAQVTPAVHIYFGGYRPLDEQVTGGVQQIEQTWYVVTAVRHPAGQQNGKATRNEAGHISSQVLAYLLGWLPGKEFTRLKLAGAPKPAFSKGGFGYVPLGFTTRLTVRGESQRPTGA